MNIKNSLGNAGIVTNSRFLSSASGGNISLLDSYVLKAL